MITPVVSIVAKSGTGKNTLLKKLINELKKRSCRVGVVKHDDHSFSIDHEGKDSWRLTQAGADTMLITYFIENRFLQKRECHEAV